ncbi:MAG: hypothetical protein JSW41_02125 [Candidatus Aenigmatarchaeota archaeon]|nr:MAG: hypothetical protein JSW41_02125 [Candidatus Aenigmarchaeota archaeon]
MKTTRWRPIPKGGNLVKIQLEDLIGKWIERSQIEKDSHVAISGDEGDGKSHLESQIITKYPGATLKDNIIYTNNPDEFYYKYDNMEVGSCMGLDDALNMIDRVDWHKLEVRDFVKHVRGKVRVEKRATFIYNVQLFRDLHPYWRNHRIRYWIELTPREWFDNMNFAYVLERARVPFITGRRDGWLLDENEKTWLNYMKGGNVIPQHYVNMLQNHPFYIGEFRFKKNDSILERYKRHRADATEEWRMEEPPPKKDKIAKLQEIIDKQNKLMYERGIKQKDIGEQIGRSPQAVHTSVQRGEFLSQIPTPTIDHR